MPFQNPMNEDTIPQWGVVRPICIAVASKFSLAAKFHVADLELHKESRVDLISKAADLASGGVFPIQLQWECP